MNAVYFAEVVNHLQFSDRFRTTWWIVLLVLTTLFLSFRHKTLIGGDLKPIDYLVVLVWTALVLLPVFREISLFGVAFKEKLEGLEKGIAGLGAEFRNSVDIRNQFTPIVLPAPPPDAQLPAIEERVQRAMENALRGMGIAREEAQTDQLHAPENATFLFHVRFNIERELRRIWHQRYQDEPSRRFTPTLQIARTLVQAGIIDPGLEGAIREVWTVASPAVHGEEVSAAQVAFARDVAPNLVSALKSI